MKLTLTQNLKRSYCKDYQNKWYIKIHIIWIIFKTKTKKTTRVMGWLGPYMIVVQLRMII